MSTATPVERYEAPPAPARVRRDNAHDERPKENSPSLYKARVRKPINWPLFWAKMKYWAFTIAAKTGGAVLYLGLISMGLRLSYTELGVKLSKVLPWLDNYELTYSWDRAHMAAIGILFFSWTFCHFMLRFLVSEEFTGTLRSIGWVNDWPKRLTFTIGVIIMTVDSCVFYRAFNAVVWGQSTFSPSAILTTLGYVTLLVATTFYSLYLSQMLKQLNKGESI